MAYLHMFLLAPFVVLVLPGCGSSHRPEGDGGGGDASATDAAETDAPSGSSCGGFAGDTCGPDEWCDYAADCGGDDGTGTCRPRPEGCGEIYMPVCGCDGVTHSNECEAQAAGVDVMHSGECRTPDGVSCNPASVDCDAPTPSCPEGQVPSVTGGCWGDCVGISQCECSAASDCPEPERYTCHGTSSRCGYYL